MATATSTKYVAIKYNPATDSQTSLTRTLQGSLADATKVSVSYNGQRIPQHTTEQVSVPNNFAKFYYTLVINATSFDITVNSNPNYRLPELAVDQPLASCNIHPDDLVYVEYTYFYTV
jgi:hypothetical protein